MPDDKKNATWAHALMDAQKQYWDNFSAILQPVELSSAEPMLDFSAITAVGPFRETIEILQQEKPLLNDIGQAFSQYQPLLINMWFEACSRAVAKCMDSVQQGTPLTGRQMYNTWIECGEQTYAEVVNTENYQKIYGNFVNASMAYKKHNQAILQKALSGMNLPTKQELDSAYENIRILTREVRASKQDIIHLKQKIQELSTLASSLQAKQAKKPKAKKTSKPASTQKTKA